MATYWPPPYYSQPQGFTPFYSPQAYPPPQYPPFPISPIAPAMPGGLPLASSNKWPKLNTLLGAGETLIRFDVQKNPRIGILANTYHHYGLQPALITGAPATTMRLYSKSFPWTIDIVSERHPITCRDIWDAVYNALQQDIDDSEWGMMVMEKKWRETVETASKMRMEEDRSSKKLKRIDLLGEATLFKGLEKDEELEKVRLLPGMDACAETCCNGCTDVIKKPKLDQHYSRCKSSVDCIDCSKSFSSPAEWKSHTSCITEAEKYQKSVYKGPKTGEPSNGYQGDVNGRGRWQGRGDMPQYRGGRGGGPGNRRLHYAATGSNGTPLGSPAREFGRSPKTNADEPAEATHSKTPSTSGEEKGKKRKAADDGESSNKKAKVGNSDAIVEAVPANMDKKTEKEGKKKKKEKSDTKKASGEDEGEQAKVEEQVEKTEAKKEKRKKRAAEKDEKDKTNEVKKAKEEKEEVKAKSAAKEEREKAKAVEREKAKEKVARKDEKGKDKAARKEEKAREKAEEKAKRKAEKAQDE